MTNEEITNLRNLLDHTISQIAYRDLVECSEMINLLLDIRLLLVVDEDLPVNSL